MNSPRFNTFVLTRSLPDRLSGIEGTAEPALFRSSEKRTKHYVVGCLLALRTLWVGGWEFHRENRDRVWCRVIWFHDLPTEENEPANSGQLVQVRKQSGPRDTDCLDAKLWTRDTRRGVRPIGWTKDVSLHPLSLSLVVDRQTADNTKRQQTRARSLKFNDPAVFHRRCFSQQGKRISPARRSSRRDV